MYVIRTPQHHPKSVLKIMYVKPQVSTVTINGVGLVSVVQGTQQSHGFPNQKKINKFAFEGYLRVHS